MAIEAGARQAGAAVAAGRLLDLAGLSLDEVLDGVRAGPAFAAVQAWLGPRPLCVATQCWWRHQVPPGTADRQHLPHAWHQDGALALDFGRDPGPQGGLLPVLTLWIALQDCGRSAPALECVDVAPARLLAPDELHDAGLRRRHAASAFRVLPAAAGQGWLFDGALIHRTQVAAGLTGSRTSLDLRFVADGPLPARLAGERLQAC